MDRVQNVYHAPDDLLAAFDEQWLVGDLLAREHFAGLDDASHEWCGSGELLGSGQTCGHADGFDLRDYPADRGEVVDSGCDVAIGAYERLDEWAESGDGPSHVSDDDSQFL